MWHHEDAGVGFNVLRNAVSSAVVASPLELNGPQSLAMRSKSMPTHYIALPGHYNDPYIIERTRHVVGTLSPEDEYWAQRAIFVHGIKRAREFEESKKRWLLSRSSPDIRLRCRPCSLPNTNRHNGNWHFLRLPCEHFANNTFAAAAAAATRFRGDSAEALLAEENARAEAASRADEKFAPSDKMSRTPSFPDARFCQVPIDDHYMCCGYPWLLPPIRSIVLRALQLLTQKTPSTKSSANMVEIAPEALYATMKQLHRAERRPEANPDCVRDCAKFQLPGFGNQLDSLLRELERRGEVSLRFTPVDTRRMQQVIGVRYLHAR